MRTIVVYDYTFDPPHEVGRAWLDEQGHAHVEGFDERTRTSYQTQGMPDFTAGSDVPEFVPLTAGERFLTAMQRKFSGTYIRADESA